MVDHNIQMKKKNKGEWENLFPFTSSKNVIHPDGKTTEENIVQVKNNIEQKANKTDLSQTNTNLLKTDEKVEKVKITLSGFGNEADYKSTIVKNDEIRAMLDEQNRFRIATFNYREGGRIPTPNTILLKAFQYVEEIGASIVGMQEQAQSGYYDIEKYKSPMFPYAHFFKSFNPKTVPPRDYGNLTISEFPMIVTGGGLIETSFPEIEQRSYNRTVYNIKGHTIAVYNTHLDHTSNDTRAEQIQFLFDVISKDNTPYKIILGDFNTRFASHWQVFLNAGYTHHNDNEFPTFKSSGEGIDGIITSPGLEVTDKNYIVTDDNVTDHNIFWCEIQF